MRFSFGLRIAVMRYFSNSHLLYHGVLYLTKTFTVKCHTIPLRLYDISATLLTHYHFHRLVVVAISLYGIKMDYNIISGVVVAWESEQ